MSYFNPILKRKPRLLMRFVLRFEHGASESEINDVAVNYVRTNNDLYSISDSYRLDPSPVLSVDDVELQAVFSVYGYDRKTQTIEITGEVQ